MAITIKQALQYVGDCGFDGTVHLDENEAATASGFAKWIVENCKYNDEIGDVAYCDELLSGYVACLGN